MKFLTLLSCVTALFITAFAQQTEPLFPGDRVSYNPKTIDVNYPDGSIVKAGSKITKTWKIHNRGMVAWDKRELRIQGDAQGFVSKPVPFSAGSTQDVNVSVELTVPKKPGHYKVFFKQWAKKDNKWQMAFPDRYKDGLYIEIVVK